MPTTGESVAPTATPAAAASVSPTPTATPVPTETGILSGKVIDVAKKLVPDGTAITAKSLDKDRPYEGSTATVDGAYVLNGVPLDTQVQLTATRPGWTRRTRVVVVRKFNATKDRTNTFNFGGKDDKDLGGAAYFLSNYPEIESVEPVDQDASLPSDNLTFKMVLSEPLTSANQRRLASAFLIVPNNAEAIDTRNSLPDETKLGKKATGATEDTAELEGLRAGANPLVDAAYRFTQNSSYLNGFTVSEFTWGADKQSATFKLQAPIKTDKEREAQYAFLLIQRDEQPILDEENNALGQTIDLKWGETKRDEIIYNAVREPSLSLSEQTIDDEKERWADTHITYSKFSVARDTVGPKLLSILARRNFVDDSGTPVDRIELSFSEPMLAFPRIASKGLLSLNNYIFAASDTEADLATRVLSPGGQSADINVNGDFLSVRDGLKSPSGMRVNSNIARDGNFLAAMSVKDPRIVIISMPANSFPLEANFIKGFVGADTKSESSGGDSVSDPAGNPVDPDSSVQVGPVY